jgi:hypothetical protein
MGLPPSRDRSLSAFSRQSQFGTLDKAVSSDFASGGIQMATDSMQYRPLPEGAATFIIRQPFSS